MEGVKRQNRGDLEEGASTLVGNGGNGSKWMKPSFGFLKLNCDAAWQNDTKVGGVGWVFRDFVGIPKFAGEVGGQQFAAAIMAEEESIRRDMEMILNSDIMVHEVRLLVESDSKGLIQMLNKEITIDVTLDIYLQDIWRTASLFQFVRFCFTPQQCNRATHAVTAHVIKHCRRFC